MTTIPAQSYRDPTTTPYNRVMGTWAIAGARVVGILAILALLGAWLATWRGGQVLGLSEQHLFNDAIVLTLMSIAGLLDGIVHRRIG